MKEYIAQDHSSYNLEDRKKRALVLINFLKKLDVENIVEDSAKKEEFIQKLSFEDFEKLIIRINGIFRDIPTSQRSIDGLDSVNIINTKDESPLYKPPFQENKKELLQEVFDAIKRIKDPEDRGAMVASTINAIHPFQDGNGRTARLLYTIISSDKDKMNIRDTNPEDLQPLIEIYINDKIHNIPKTEINECRQNQNVGETMKAGKNTEFKFLDAFIFDQANVIAAIELYFSKKNINFGKVFLDHEKNFLTKDFLESATSNDVRGVLDTYQNLKKEFVKVMIDAFENPSNYIVKNILPEEMLGVNAELENKSLKEIFYLSTDKRSKKNSHFSWDYFMKIMGKQ